MSKHTITSLAALAVAAINADQPEALGSGEEQATDPNEITQDLPVAEPINPLDVFLTNLRGKISQPGTAVDLAFDTAAWLQEKSFTRLALTGLRALGDLEIWASTRVHHLDAEKTAFMLLPIADEGNGTVHHGVDLWIGQPGTAKAEKIVQNVPFGDVGEDQDCALYRSMKALLKAYEAASPEERAQFAEAGIYYEHTGSFSGRDVKTCCLAWRLSDVQVPQRVTMIVSNDPQGRPTIQVDQECISLGTRPAFKPNTGDTGRFARTQRTEGRPTKEARKAFRALVEAAIKVAGPVPTRQIQPNRTDVLLQAERARRGLATSTTETTDQATEAEVQGVIDDAFAGVE